MTLTLLGRKCDNPSSKECCYIWELMAMVLNDMVLQVARGNVNYVITPLSWRSSLGLHSPS